MMRFPLFASVVLAAALAGGAALAQDGAYKKRTGVLSQTAVAQGPVTQAEAAAALGKVEKAIEGVLKSKPAKASALRKTAQPVSREQVVLEMDRLLEAARPSFRFTPRPAMFDPRQLTIGDDARPAAERLVTLGFLPRAGVLAAGTQKTVTLKEFGDELGLFIARIGELTHTPSSKWSPYLQGG
jgi:hypothetical protein